MRYVCLAIFDAAKLHALPKSESDTFSEECLAYDETLRQSGHYVCSQALQAANTAATVRVSKGKLSIIDGPFTETKEQIGGFIVIDARDLNDAIQVASKMPLARIGSVEVRPVHEQT